MIKKEELTIRSTSSFCHTRFEVSARDTGAKWVNIRLPPASHVTDDVLAASGTSKSLQHHGDGTNSIPSETGESQSVPESVLQYQRQLRKVKAADRACNTDVNAKDHLSVVYQDDHILVVDKPSGILCVPGINKNRSLLDLAFEEFGKTDDNFSRENMVVHRLDMDTSGLVIFARSRAAMTRLHESFRGRTETKKSYEALVLGKLDIDAWLDSACVAVGGEECGSQLPLTSENIGGGQIDLPLQRDHRHPPFMRVATPESSLEAKKAVKDLNTAGFRKLVAKKPKSSTTQFIILSHELWKDHPVTRVELIPITGRTHQLRVHLAALGHPILGDPCYGWCGEAHPNGGFTDQVILEASPTCASFDLRKMAEESVGRECRTLCLHAKKISIRHPISGQEMTFEAPPSF